MRWRRRSGIAVIGVALSLAAGASPASALPRIGLNDSLVDPSNAETVLAYHRSLHVDTIRQAFQWRAVQPHGPGEWDWRYYDQVVSELAGEGMGIVALMLHTPGWAQAPQPLGPCTFDPHDSACRAAPDPRRFPEMRRFVEQLVARYPAIVALEFYNEPNVGSFGWQPAADPSGYAAALRVAHDAARAVRPGLPVVIGGMTYPTTLSSNQGAMDPPEFLRGVYAAGGLGAFDGIGIHSYPGTIAPEDPGGWRYHLDSLRKVRDGSGDRARPLWITETGYTTTGPKAVSAEQQAEWLPQIVSGAAAQPDVASVLVHTLRDGDDPDRAENGYGLMSTSFAPKAVFHSVQAAFAAIKAAKERAAAVAREQVAAAKAKRKQKAASKKKAKKKKAKKKKKKKRKPRRTAAKRS